MSKTIARRIAGIILLGLALIWIVRQSIQDIDQFLNEHHGIEFYKQKPEYLLICAGIGIAVGGILLLGSKWQKKRSNRNGNHRA